MDEEQFYIKLHRRIAQLSVGASTLRNQGNKGLIEICRNYFEENIKPQDFFESISTEETFKKFLNSHTESIVELFPENAKSWGAARKGLNIFFRDLSYNKYFADKYKLPDNFCQNNEKLKFLEIPLDNDVASSLNKVFPKQLPKWNGIKKLLPNESDFYQEKAKELAEEKNIARVHLDLIFWRKKR